MAEFNPDIIRRNEDDKEHGKHPERINCIHCVYYEVTWEQDNPRGCTMFGFKSKQMPSKVVMETTGKPCPAFTPKKKK